MAKAKVRNRFSEEQRRAAVADLATMTIDEAAKRHGCSAGSLWTWKKKFQTSAATSKPRGRRSATPTAPAAGVDRLVELEAENSRLRRMLLVGFIQNESNAKLKRIAEVLRDGGHNQLQEIMETLLASEAASVASRTDNPEATSENSHRKRAH